MDDPEALAETRAIEKNRMCFDQPNETSKGSVPELEQLGDDHRDHPTSLVDHVKRKSWCQGSEHSC